MLVVEEAPAAAAWSAGARRRGHAIGFVPTMGALHEGHLSLLAEARKTCSSVIASIFVNPLQFNDSKDLQHYPRQVEQDLHLLRGAGCDMVFLPSEAGIFRDHTVRKFDLGGLDEVLEGPSRPGHFQGVVNVVERLFHFVRPDRAFFGEKDRQQLTVIQYVAQRHHWPERIIACPTARAADGLALSSRNQRLSPAERKAAPTLHRALMAVKALAFQRSPMEARRQGLAVLAEEPLYSIDYLDIVDPLTLRSLESWGELDKAIVLVAATLGPVRLIDNLTLHR